jgi:hypothetical protein
MYENAKEVYVNEFISTGTKSGFFTASWTSIVSMNIVDELNGGEAFYTMCFDSPENGSSYSVFDGSGRREVASSDAAVHLHTGDSDWYYRDNSTGTVTSANWTKATENNYLVAISQAVGAGANNQMSSTTINGVTETQWNGTGGFAEDQTRFDMSVTLRSINVQQSPNVSAAVLTVDQVGEATMSIGSDGDYSFTSHTVEDVKTFTVNKRNDGQTSTTITYK